MKLKFSSIWLFLAAAMLGMDSNSLSQVVTHQPAGYSIGPIKEVSLSISIETNAITGVSTNVLKCRLVNESTNVIRSLKCPLTIEFRNAEGGQNYHLPAFESVDMKLITNQTSIYIQIEELKPGQTCEWCVFFSIGHPFDLARIPERDSTNQNVKIHYDDLNSKRLVTFPGNYRMNVANWIVVPDKYGGAGFCGLDSNYLELRVTDLVD